MTREVAEINILEWANNKGLLDPSNLKTQMLKLVAEVGELADDVIKEDRKKIIDELGDCEVVLTIMKEQLGVHENLPIVQAWEKIKNRTGKTVNGTFIKD